MADRTRIAVVLIHGMGEPRPMATINRFVEAIAATETPPIKSWSKPLNDPSLYDIRRIVMAGSKMRPVVDFYEFYWAHLMRGNKLAQLVRWLKVLVFRSPTKVPKHLQRIYWTGWLLMALLAALIVAIAWSLFQAGTLFSIWPWIWAAITLAYGLVSYWLLGTLGDAARYLDKLPDNVRARFEIQKAGVDLIKRLHTGGYHRIIVVGHSLGAMIGYDVLRQAWLPFAVNYDANTTVNHRKAIDNLRFAVRDWATKPQTAAEYRKLQELAWAEHLGNGGGWRVTDFITLGAPLAHAEVLMAVDPADFARRSKGRELSTCPPTWDEKFGITRDIQVGGRRVRTPDHASAFALTRWTNLYSPSAFVFDGDFLSGPVVPVFGAGITDIKVSANHVNYWTQGPGEPLKTLVTTMDLSGRDAGYAPATGVELGSAEDAPPSD